MPGGQLAAVEAGAGGAPTLVLVPGFTGSKEDFRLIVSPLASAGLRVIALDQRGQYESTGPADPAAYTVDALAGDLLAVIDALGDGPVHLVGHSFGGLVCRATVLRNPAAVRSLTLLSSGPAGLTGSRTEALAHLGPLLEAGGLAAVADVLDAQAAADPARRAEPPELRSFLRTRFLVSSPVGLLAMGEALQTEPDRVEELRTSGVPVLVSYGVDDDAWPPSVQAGMAERLGARHVVIPAAMHSPAVENPAATAEALVAFVTSVGSSADTV